MKINQNMMYKRIPIKKSFRFSQCFRTKSSSLTSQLKTEAEKSWTAFQDTYRSTKDVFEKHRVVFTLSTSIASVATAWAGYSLRHYHQSRVDQRLASIEKAMSKKYDIEDPEFKKLVSWGISLPACVATAGTTLIIGYGLGWRGGKWYANRKFRREQMTLLGQGNPKRWPLKLLGKVNPRRWPLRLPLSRLKLKGNASKAPETPTLAQVATPTQGNASKAPETSTLAQVATPTQGNASKAPETPKPAQVATPTQGNASKAPETPTPAQVATPTQDASIARSSA